MNFFPLRFEAMAENKAKQYGAIVLGAQLFRSDSLSHVTRLGLWRMIYHSWHKLHFYKKIKHCKIFFYICNAEMA